jgi:hypothetical protein
LWKYKHPIVRAEMIAAAVHKIGRRATLRAKRAEITTASPTIGVEYATITTAHAPNNKKRRAEETAQMASTRSGISALNGSRCIA